MSLYMWNHSEPDKLCCTVCAIADKGGTATKLAGQPLFTERVLLISSTAAEWHVFDSLLQTIGELFLVLSEMGFTEEQIQAALQAGHFSVTEAAEWWVDFS